MGFTNTRQKFLSEGIGEPWKLVTSHKYSIFIVLIILITTNMSFSAFLNIYMWLKMKLTTKLHKI